MFGEFVFNLAIDPQTPSTLYATTFQGPSKSADGGLNWKAARTGLPPTLVRWPGPAIAVDPQRSTTLYFSDDNGLFKSTDGAQSWNAVNFPARVSA